MYDQWEYNHVNVVAVVDGVKQVRKKLPVPCGVVPVGQVATQADWSR